MFEKSVCALCGIDASEPLLAKNGFNIVKCKNCSLVYVNPRIDSETLRQMYETDLLDPFDYLFQNRIVDAKTFGRHLDLIEIFKKNKGRLLDVGCGLGILIGIAKKRGWHACGVELTGKFTKYCREQGLNVKQGLLENADLPDGFFDVAVMTGSIEHVPDPLATLRLIRKKLKGRGLLLLTTPDIGSMHARLLGKHWLQLKPDEHLHYFSKSTIKKILEKGGFEVLLCQYLSSTRTLKTVIEKTGQMFGISIPKKITANFSKVSFNFNPRDELLVLAKASEADLGT